MKRLAIRNEENTTSKAMYHLKMAQQRRSYRQMA
jgi:hypothetical protein